MAGQLCGETARHGAPEANFRVSQGSPEKGVGRWYFSRKELEENSPSRLDGIDLKKEAYLRKSYCTFLQDLGMRLKVPQVTIATAIIFCQRFFLRQSHAKNDRRTIATVCMFLAGKVEETPRPLKDVILVSYEIINKKDAAAVQRIKQKEVYEQQKELILVGERVVLGTLGFDMNVNHPYKPLVEAIKKFQVAQNALARVAWNFVNDGLRTSLCLQFKPHHIAAGAIFLAAKFLKVKLPSDGDKVWWQEFDVTPRQLEEVSNQMLELYEQNRMPPNEPEGSTGGSQCPASKGPTDEEHLPSKPTPSSKPEPSRPLPNQPHANNHNEPSKKLQSRNNDHGSSETVTFPNRKADGKISNIRHREQEVTPLNSGDMENKYRLGFEGHNEDDQEGSSCKNETRDLVEPQDKYHGRNLSSNDGTIGQSPQDTMKKLDREKLKAAFERRKAARGDLKRKIDPVDELERELEDVEVPSETEKIKRDGKKSGPKQLNRAEKGQLTNAEDFDAVEEGELDPFDEMDKSSSRKRKPTSPLDRTQDGKQRADYVPGPQKQNHHGYEEDRNGLGRIGLLEKDHKRQLQENHV